MKFPIQQKQASLPRCAARGEEVYALHTARTRKCATCAHFIFSAPNAHSYKVAPEDFVSVFSVDFVSVLSEDLVSVDFSVSSEDFVSVEFVSEDFVSVLSEDLVSEEFVSVEFVSVLSVFSVDSVVSVVWVGSSVSSVS